MRLKRAHWPSQQMPLRRALMHLAVLPVQACRNTPPVQYNTQWSMQSAGGGLQFSWWQMIGQLMVLN